MLKRITLLLLTLTLVVGGLVTAHAMDQEEKYTCWQEELLRYLNGEEGAIPLDTLATQFSELGRYKKSPLFGYYTSLLRDAEAGDTSRLELYTRLLRLDADFCAMLPESGFPTVDEVEAYALGRQAQAAEDWPAAIAYYEESIEVLDSVTRVMELLTAEPVLVAEGVVYGDYVIDTYSDRTCVITDYAGRAEQLEIPGIVGGYPVVGIWDDAFRFCDSTNISIPDSVTSIGDNAFLGCVCLTSISIPNSVTSIGNNAFNACGSLTSITIPDSVTSIGDGLFLFCPATIIVSSNHPVLEIVDGVLFDKTEKRLISYPNASSSSSYTIPHGTQIIGNTAFHNCDSLTSISIPDSVTSIGESAFFSCDSLTRVSIPDSVTSIGESAFHSCDSLTSVSIPDSVTSIRDYTFGFCDSLTSITIPNSVTSIGNGAFMECSSLASVSITDSVTSIGSWAFDACPNLTLRVPTNSYAHQYAIENNIPYITY